MPLSPNLYKLKTYNIYKSNKWATLKKEGDGTFFIHPGVKKPTIALFTFKKSGLISLDFWIRKGSKAGDIQFKIYKNNDKIKDFNIVAKGHRHTSFGVSINEGDKLTIVADKHGDTYYDWGEFRITFQDRFFIIKNFIIPFLWAILFVYLIGKRHKYIALASYSLFFLIIFAEKLNFGYISFEHLLIYTIFIFALTFSFVFLYQELKRFKIATILSFIAAFFVYVVPLSFVIYALNFGHKVTKDTLFAVFQSNTIESYEYVSDFISYKYIALFVLFTAIIGYILYKQEKKETVLIERSLLLFMIVVFYSISTIFLADLRLPRFIIESFKQYDKELRLFKNMQAKRVAGQIKFDATKKNKGETYIFIIGESLNKRHMGIYGYVRNTTPNLSKMVNKLLVFKNIYSNHTHTVPVLSLALTQANQYNKKTYYESLSIIDILKKAGFETYWLTNQAILGAWDNLVSIIGTSADHLVALNRNIGTTTSTNQYDGALIDEVKKVLSKRSAKNRVIFVHLMGNHSTYSSRYPHDKFTIYKGSLRKGVFGRKALKVGYLNDYDNSIVYNDYVVSTIFKEAMKNKDVFAVIYMPDHADDVIDKLGHNSSNFTFYMTQIPMIAWFSNSYKQQYSDKYKNLVSHLNTLFSNDMLYDTLIGIFDIKTKKYNPKYDFSSKKYALKPKDALTLHGKKHYIDKSNHIYWQQFNAQYLCESNQSTRIFPFRVDSIGKLKDIWQDGFRSFELDVIYGDNNTNSFLVEPQKGISDVTFEEFISFVDSSKIKKIWLDFKNLNRDNYKKALKRLSLLDKKYHFKNRTIVEATTTEPFFNEFRKNDWHISYYLPTNTILKSDSKSLKLIAQQIANQTKEQNLSAISFDSRVYSFVKHYLEPLISKRIVYHSWFAPALYDTKFREKLLKNRLYQDKRVKTILAPYDSQFDL